LIGVLGAVAAEAVALPAWIRGALKHDAPADPERHAPNEVAADAVDSMITPKPFKRSGVAVGAAGVDVPQLASTHAVTIEPTEATNVRMAIAP
jgi:hypothetical protein